MPKCDVCGREFNTEEGLKQHTEDKHSLSSHAKKEAKKEQTEIKQHATSSALKRKRIVRTIGILAVIVIVISAAAWVVLNMKSTALVSGSNNSLGSSSAPVVMLEYSDFQCPFCGRFYTETEPQIISDYVDTGKVRFVYRHFPLASHPYAEKAAEASECAAQQNRFWDYYNVLFKNQNSLDISSLKNYAVQLGLDTVSFNSCLDSGAMQPVVSQDVRAADAVGVSSVPIFFINGAKIEGAQPYTVFKQAIDAALGG